MIDIFMLVLVILLSIILLIISIYILAYYCSEDDSEFGSGILCKIVAILGLMIGWGQILLLPLDVSNSRLPDGQFRMDVLYQILYIVIASFIFFILPLLISIYECDPSWSFCEKLKSTLCFFLFSLVILAVLFGVLYLFLHTAKIPLSSFECPYAEEGNKYESKYTIGEEEELTASCTSVQNASLSLKVSFPIFSIGLLSLISYILLSIFGGVGLASLPMDMIYSYCSREIRIDSRKVEELKKEIIETAIDLKELGMKVKEQEKKGIHKMAFYTKDKRIYNDLLKQFKAGFNILDEEYQIINQQNILSNDYVICYYFKLLGGIFFLILSLTWLLQILFYILLTKNNKPLYPFLNSLLVSLTTHNMHFLAIFIFSILSYYLLLCTIKGNLKFGLRMLCCGQIYPLKKNDTFMNAILFNILLSMLTCVSLTEFCVKAFNEYAANTEIDVIFSVQIKHLMFFEFFLRNNIFEYVLVFFFGTTMIYLLIRPSDNNTMRKILYKKINDIESRKDEKLIQ